MGETVTSNQSTSGTRESTAFRPVVDLARSDALPLADEWYNQYGRGQGLWSGPNLAAQNPLIGEAQRHQLGIAAGMGDQFRDVNRTMQGFLDTSPKFDFNSAQNRHARDMLGARIQRQFNQSIAPSIQNMGTDVGQFGGNQQSIAMGAASAPLSEAIAGAELGLTNRMMDDHQAALGRSYNTMLNAPSLIGSQLLPSQIMGDIGAQRTMRGQQELLDSRQQYEAPRQNFTRTLAEGAGLTLPFSGLGQTGNFGQESYSENYYPSSYLKGGGGGGFGSAVSGALGGAGVGFQVSGGNPLGAAAGGVLGGLGALF
jgi:hypothetical protein